MTPVLYKYKHTLSLNFTMLRNPCWTHYFTNFYKIWFLHWVSLSNFIFISFFQKCSYKAVKCLYFLRQGLIWCCMHCHARLFISRSISSSPADHLFLNPLVSRSDLDAISLWHETKVWREREPERFDAR